MEIEIILIFKKMRTVPILLTRVRTCTIPEKYISPTLLKGVIGKLY